MYFESKSADAEIDLNNSEMSPDTTQTSSVSAGTVLWSRLPFIECDRTPEVPLCPLTPWVLLGTTFHSLEQMIFGELTIRKARVTWTVTLFRLNILILVHKKSSIFYL